MRLQGTLSIARGRAISLLAVVSLVAGLLVVASAVEATTAVNAVYDSHTGTLTPAGGTIAQTVASPDDGKFLQMAPESTIVMKFPGSFAAVPDGTSAPDLQIDIFDALFSATAEVLTSMDGLSWTSQGFFADTADIDLDLSGPVKYVKLSQPTLCDPGPVFCIDQAFPTLGFDLDGVVALTAATGQVSGGGQILDDDPLDRKGNKPFKVSFGGYLFRYGVGFGAIPVVSCEWQVNFHNVSVDSLDKAKFHATFCSDHNAFLPNPPADGIVNFKAHGTLNGVPGYTVTFRMEDKTEPGAMDTIRMTLSGPLTYDTSDFFGGDFDDQSNNVGTRRTFVDHGNLQIMDF